jgi:ABC-type uncharacterized transport system permease subunit
VQQGDIAPLAAWGYRLLAVLAALAAGGLFLASLGYNPFQVYGTMLSGALGTPGMQRETIKLTIPLALTSLGVLLAFKMRFWNIGAEGQIAAGAIAASYFAYFQSHLPSGILLPLMALAAITAGGLWGLIPAWFKTRFGTNETLFTLMLNYIVMHFITYLRRIRGYPALSQAGKVAGTALPLCGQHPYRLDCRDGFVRPDVHLSALYQTRL